ncbi:oxidoreductase family, NAD-binding rossmann fold domain-containing protein [Sarocladium implicatum]|nr:oxidoreductase family, NAD-binding rossmann fold domain-containing protein [Sarocladium implicatum]
MSPIRIGIIGLTAKDSGAFVPGEWGVQHFKAIQALPAYELVAVCNTSVESASKAIAFHKLDPATVKAYGSAKDLAADPNVDLVTVAVDVNHHVELTKPVLEAGKNVYVEFPIAPTAEECEELAELAKAKGAKVVVGTQAHSDPVMTKLRNTLPEIGDVVSTTILGSSPLDVSQGWPEAAESFLDVNGRVSRIVIVLGHLLGGFNSVVGEFAELQSVYKTQTKTTTLLDGTYQPSKPNHPVTAPDQMFLQGVLKSGAIATINVRTNASPVDGVGFRWIISGTQGEIEVVTKPGFIQAGLTGTIIRLRKSGEETAKEVEWKDAESEAVAKIEGFPQGIARSYAAFAEGREADYGTIESGLAVHRAMERATKNALWA